MSRSPVPGQRNPIIDKRESSKKTSIPGLPRANAGLCTGSRLLYLSDLNPALHFYGFNLLCSTIRPPASCIYKTTLSPTSIAAAAYESRLAIRDTGLAGYRRPQRCFFRHTHALFAHRHFSLRTYLRIARSNLAHTVIVDGATHDNDKTARSLGMTHARAAGAGAELGWWK